MTEDEMDGWHHRLDGHDFEQALGDDEGQGSQACYSPWGCKESDTTEQLNNKGRESPGDLTCFKSCLVNLGAVEDHKKNRQTTTPFLSKGSAELTTSRGGNQP